MAALTADHQSANDFTNIPSEYFTQVRSKFHIYYGHTSHGSQLITGINMLDSQNAVLYAPPSIYDDYRIDLGDSAWESDTRNYLNNHPQSQPGYVVLVRAVILNTAQAKSIII